MNKLLIILLISIFVGVYEKQDWAWIEAYGELEAKGYLPKIENALRYKGKEVALDLCVRFLNEIYGRRLSQEEPIPDFDDDDTKGSGKGEPIPDFHDDDDDEGSGYSPDRENPRYRFLCQQIIYISFLFSQK